MELSVIIITYNQQEYIGQCIDSVIDNCAGIDCEILIGDDASSDSTPDIIRQRASGYPHTIIPVLRSSNTGAMSNYYDLLSKVSGDIVMVCGGDDYWLPGKVAMQLRYFREHPECGLIYGKATVISASGATAGEYPVRGAISPEAFMANNDVPAPTIAVRRSELMRYLAEVRPEQQNWLCEDWPMLLWFSLRSKIGFIPDGLAAYRRTAVSATHSPDYLKNRMFAINDADIRLFFIARFNAPPALSRYISAAKAIAIAEKSLIETGFLTTDDKRNLMASARSAHAGIRNRIYAVWLRLAPASFMRIRRKRHLKRILSTNSL